MTSQPEKQAIATKILQNISRSRSNKKFGQLIGYNISNTLFRKIIHKIRQRNMVRDPLLLIKIEHFSRSIVYTFIQFLFVCQVEDYQKILKLRCRPLRFTSYKAFLKKQKVVWNQSPCLTFALTFHKKYFSCYILLTDHLSFSGCLQFVRYWAICALQLLFNQVMTS